MRALVVNLFILCVARAAATKAAGSHFLASNNARVADEKKSELQQAVTGLADALGRELGADASSARASELLNKEIEKVTAQDPVRGALLTQYLSRVPTQAILILPVKQPYQPLASTQKNEGTDDLKSDAYSQSTVLESDGSRAVQRTTVCKNGICQERTSVGRLAPQPQDMPVMEEGLSRPRSSMFDWMWGMGDTLQSASDTLGTASVGSMFDDIFSPSLRNAHHGLLDDEAQDFGPGKSWSSSMSSSSKTVNGHTVSRTRKCVNGVCNETSTKDGTVLEAAKEMPSRTAKKVASDIAVNTAPSKDLVAEEGRHEKVQGTSQSTSVEEVLENGKMVRKITKCVNGKCTTTTEVGEVAQPNMGFEHESADLGNSPYADAVF